MGREVKRVPLDFDWPQGETWQGFLTPDELRETSCPDCENGYSSEAQHLFDQWYGYAPFDPAETGSKPLTPQSRAVWRFAKRNVERSPESYGRGFDATHREAKRLVEMWNGQWSHHLEQADVDALIAGGRLMDFTHDWSPETRWTPKVPCPRPTPREVNDWNILTMGHDSINAGVCVRAKARRRGFAEVCPTCEGHGEIEKYPGQRAEAEAWEPIEPPTGEGWQMWETTSEGSPMSPVFATPEELAAWLASSGASLFGSNTADRDQWLKIITGEDFAHVVIAPGVVMM